MEALSRLVGIFEYRKTQMKNVKLTAAVAAIMFSGVALANGSHHTPVAQIGIDLGVDIAAGVNASTAASGTAAGGTNQHSYVESGATMATRSTAGLNVALLPNPVVVVGGASQSVGKSYSFSIGGAGTEGYAGFSGGSYASVGASNTLTVDVNTRPIKLDATVKVGGEALVSTGVQGTSSTGQFGLSVTDAKANMVTASIAGANVNLFNPAVTVFGQSFTAGKAVGSNHSYGDGAGNYSAGYAGYSGAGAEVNIGLDLTKTIKVGYINHHDDDHHDDD